MGRISPLGEMVSNTEETVYVKVACLLCGESLLCLDHGVCIETGKIGQGCIAKGFECHVQ